MSVHEPSLTVAVCTRGRPRQLQATLAALRAQTDPHFRLLVIDQGEEAAAERREGPPEEEVLPDRGRGLSRARNLALRATESEWIAFVDDDCLVADDFVAAVRGELRGHPGVDWLSGDVSAGGAPAGQLPITTFPVDRERIVRGRWTLPGSIGFGVLFVVRRSAARELGGWDERLGPGVEPFPAADDMDFNHRLLRSGRSALLSPRVRARHDQWRTEADVPRLHRGYVRAWAGFAMKHVRGGNVAGGLWLWAWGLVDVLDMLDSAVRRRSRFRLRVARAKLRGLAEGTVAGARRRW